MRAGFVAWMAVLLCTTVLAGDVESIGDLFTKGKTKADIGLNFRSTWEDGAAAGEEDEGHLCWAYYELGHVTPEVGGLSLGGSLLGVNEMWGKDIYKDEFSDDGHWLSEDPQLKYLYLTYAIPKTKSSLLVGRKKFKKIALMDGDIQEGVQLAVGDIPRTKLYVGLITGWQDDLSQSWDNDGVEDFTRDPDDTVDRGTNAASDKIYMCIADIDAIEKHLTLTPFVVHHPDYLTTYGSLAKATMPVNDDVTLGLDGGWAEFAEDTKFDGDEDAQTWKIHASAKVKNYYVGIGYYRVSDSPDGVFQGANAAKTVGNYHWEPIKVGKVGLYAGGKGGDVNDRTAWVDAGFDIGKFSLDMVYGDSDYTHGKKGHEQSSQELDVIASYKVTKAYSASLGFLGQKYKNDTEKDRNFVMGGVKYSFF